MAARNPVRPLDSANSSIAYPKELLINYTNGNFTIIDGSGNSISHNKPGSINISLGNTSILPQSGLDTNISIDLLPYLANTFANRFGICSTEEQVTAKTVILQDYVLIRGSYITIRFTNPVPTGSTLNINNTGAKPIYYRGTSITNDIIGSGDLVTFIYDGTNYQVCSIDYIDGNNLQF